MTPGTPKRKQRSDLASVADWGRREDWRGCRGPQQPEDRNDQTNSCCLRDRIHRCVVLSVTAVRCAANSGFLAVEQSARGRWQNFGPAEAALRHRQKRNKC